MSRFLTANEASDVSRLLSTPRLNTFQKLVKSESLEDAIELHQATMSLGVAITAVTGLIEVAIRNSACSHLQQAFDKVDWLTAPPASLNWSPLELRSISQAKTHAKRAKYSKLSGADKKALDALAFPTGLPQNIGRRTQVSRRQSTISVTEGEVVAQLTMHFWKRLFSENYQKTLWKRGLKRVFPNKQLDRPQIAAHLEVIYQTRNRLAHHEPIYGGRLTDTLLAIEFMSLNLESKKPSTDSPFYKLILPQLDTLSGQVAIFQATYTRLS
jgi:hypothetical protein